MLGSTLKSNVKEPNKTSTQPEIPVNRVNLNRKHCVGITHVQVFLIKGNSTQFYLQSIDFT